MTPPCSQPQRTPPDGAANASSPSSITLYNFATLPHELQSYTLELACSLRHPSSHSGANIPPVSNKSAVPGLDVITTLNLLTVSKAFHSLAIPILLRNVALHGPSALATFAKALTKRPELGSLVKWLRIGDVGPLPTWAVPVRSQGSPFSFDTQGPATPLRRGTSTILTTLRTKEEADLLPRGCTPDKEWPLLTPAAPDARSTAAFEALVSAQRSLDISLSTNFCKYSDPRQQMSVFQYMVLMFEAQAAFELYLMALRRWEDQGRSTYPTLHITGYPPLPRATKAIPHRKAERYTVTRHDILRHLARPHSVTDRFDHPVYVVRSALIDADLRAEDHRKSALPEAHRRPIIPLEHTIESLIILARFVLRRTPQLKTLIVTSFLDSAASGGEYAFAPPTLRNYSFGRSQIAHGPIGFGKMTGVEYLRVCSVEDLDQEEIDEMISEMPRLKMLEWSLPEVFTIEQWERMAGTLSRLMKYPVNGPLSRGASQDQGRGGEGSSSSSPGSDPLIKIMLHPSTFNMLLSVAPTEAIRAAWKSGEREPGQRRRVLLVNGSEEEGEGRWGESWGYEEIEKGLQGGNTRLLRVV